MPLVLAVEPEADGHVLEVGNDPRVQERRLADAALAVQHEHAGLGPAEDPGEPLDVVVAAGEQGAVLGAVGGQRQVGLVRQGRRSTCLRLARPPRPGRPGDRRAASQRASAPRTAPPSRTWPTGSTARGAASRADLEVGRAVGAIEQAERGVPVAEPPQDLADRLAVVEERRHDLQPERAGHVVERPLLGGDDPGEVGVVERLEERAEAPVGRLWRSGRR